MSHADVLKLLAMLEASLQEIPHAQIAREFGVSRAECAKRVLLGFRYLLVPERLGKDEVPRDAMRWSRHVDFWLKQIGKERARLKRKL
jgi:hypothetical protein